MRLVSPSYITYVIYALYCLNLISREQASLFWPLEFLITWIGFALIVLFLTVPYSYTNDYNNVFVLPLYEGFENYPIVTSIVSAVLKWEIYKRYPRNNDYWTENIVLFILYILSALYISQHS